MSEPISASEAAKRLGVSTTTVHRLAAAGDLPYIAKFGGLRGAYLFDPAVIALYARQRRTNGRRKAS